MPSQFSAIGFDVTSSEDLAALASRVADRAETINVAAGQYLHWTSPSGEELWLQLKRSGDAMGMNPHFSGKSSVRVALEARISRPTHTPLDGTFLGWANPPAGAVGGDYPFAFDCPNAAVYADVPLPVLAVAQVAAFAQQVTVYESADAYQAAQAAQGLAFAAQSFIPSGLVSPGGVPVDPPEPHALFVGVVLEAAARQNAITGHPYGWALVETIGGTFDVVIDPELLTDVPRAGNILSGWFWLSGRLQAEAPAKTGWLRRLAGR